MNYKRTKSWLKFVRRFRFHKRKYKDRLFQRVFQDKEDLLELYNAITGTEHQNPEELEITTYIVFYNGTEKIPDDYTLLLSDAFESDPSAKDMEPALECKARILNVNSGHNAELMNKCRRLMHYSLFIARIRQNIDRGMPIEQAIDESISYCIRHDILKDVLLKNRSEVRHMLLTEFDEKKFAKSIWKEGHESGYTEGHNSGYTEGCKSILEILDAINRGNDTIEKLTALGYDAKTAQEVLEKK